MSEPWIFALRDRMAQATARNVSQFAKLADLRSEIASDVERRLATLGDAAEAHQQVDDARHKRVLAALRAGAFQGLTIREQRHAATLLAEVAAAQLQAFLAACPRNWPTFVAECFRRWDDFDGVAERAAYTRLLCLAPLAVKPLQQIAEVVRVQDLVSSDGPAMLARAIRADGPAELRDALRQRGFEPRWAFTARVIACWVFERAQQPRMFMRAWAALASDRLLEAMLLPPGGNDAHASWFSNERRPVVRRSVTTQAIAVGALLRAAATGSVDEAAWAVLTERLLHSTFGDPRVPPESEGWDKLRRRDQHSYQRFFEQLISEDITVFFEHAMEDERRKVFWLGYVGSLRRTVCVLDRDTHAQLTRQFAGADARHAAVVGRAKRFRTQSCAQAFCLYFDSHVVVEFSETGNAAQIYERDYFVKQFERVVDANRCSDSSALKMSPARPKVPGVGERILHQRDWESSAQSKLRQLGIVRGSARPPHGG